MHPSIRVLSEARKPLIRFIGKRQWPSTPEAPHAHPGAPQEVKDAFGDFVKKIKASASSGAASGTPSKSAAKKGGDVYGEFWEMPSRFWKPRAMVMEEAEIDAITTGGASLYQQ